MLPSAPFEHETLARGELNVDSSAVLVLRARVGQVRDVEARPGTGEDQAQRLPLTFVIGEEVGPILPYRSSERGADLLVRIRQHAIGHEIGGLETIVTKISRHRAGEEVGAGFGHGIDLDSAGPSLR